MTKTTEHEKTLQKIKLLLQQAGCTEVKINEPSIDIVIYPTKDKLHDDEPHNNRERYAYRTIKKEETQESQSSNELFPTRDRYSKIGFLVGGKVVVYRRVFDFHRVGNENYYFKTSIKKRKEWVTEKVAMKGKVLFWHST